jgi:hypothetical protein
VPLLVSITAILFAIKNLLEKYKIKDYQKMSADKNSAYWQAESRQLWSVSLNAKEHAP